MKLRAWGVSDVGMKRDKNEDSFLLEPDMGLFAVADGMGGHQGGERASRLAVEIIGREVRRVDLGDPQPAGPGVDVPAARGLRGASELAGRTIYDMAETDPELLGMGTTLTSLLFFGQRAYLAHVGDSRAYLFRDDRIEQLTEDHSWIEEQVRAGLLTKEEAETSALKHVITRSVGFEREVEVDLVVLPFLMGDCFLICSDGLSNYISEDDLRDCLRKGYFAEVPRRLVAEANSRGGDDNITVVLVYVANEVDRRPRPDGKPTDSDDDTIRVNTHGVQAVPGSRPSQPDDDTLKVGLDEIKRASRPKAPDRGQALAERETEPGIGDPETLEAQDTLPGYSFEAPGASAGDPETLETKDTLPGYEFKAPDKPDTTH